MKVTKSFGLVKELPVALSSREDNSDNGFWAFASREVVDSMGDIVRQDGLTFGEYHRPEDGVYLKILAQHIKSLPDGKAPVVGLVKDYVKTSVPYKGQMVKATAVYIEWLRNPETGELLELAKHYKEMKDAGGIDQTSVGMMVTGYKEIPDGGLDITKADLYEISLVSVPALASANFIKMKEAGYEVDEAVLQQAEQPKEEAKHVEEEISLHPVVLRELLKKIDKLEAEKAQVQPFDPNALKLLIGEAVSEALKGLAEPLLKSHTELQEKLGILAGNVDVIESALVVLSDSASSRMTDNLKAETDKALKEATKKLADIAKFVGN